MTKIATKPRPLIGDRYADPIPLGPRPRGSNATAANAARGGGGAVRAAACGAPSRAPRRARPGASRRGRAVEVAPSRVAGLAWGLIADRNRSANVPT